MTAAMARGSFVVLLFTVAVASQGVRGEVYEVALPAASGNYSLYGWKDVNIDLGFPLSDIHDVRFRVEGTGVAAVVSGPFNPGRRDVVFALHLHREAGGPLDAYGPGAGLTTYPAPEPFTGEGSFRPPVEWNFLEDGVARGTVALWPVGSVDIESRVTGGSGMITGAWLIIDATPVPEPGVVALFVAGAGVLLRRRRRRGAVGWPRRWGMGRYSLVGVVLLVSMGSDAARAEIYEVPLPEVVGEYPWLFQRKSFAINLGFPLAEITDVRFRAEGAIVAPLAGHDYGPYIWPRDGMFRVILSDPGESLVGYTARVGLDTYPAPEPFAGETVLTPATGKDYGFLLDGSASGELRLLYSGHVFGISYGSGVISSASLWIDATPVPEPGVVGVAGVGVGMLWRLRRRRCGRVCSGA